MKPSPCVPPPPALVPAPLQLSQPLQALAAALRSPQNLLLPSLPSPSSPSFSSQKRGSTTRIITGVSSGPNPAAPALPRAGGSGAGRRTPGEGGWSQQSCPHVRQSQFHPAELTSHGGNPRQKGSNGRPVTAVGERSENPRDQTAPRTPGRAEGGHEGLRAPERRLPVVGQAVEVHGGADPHPPPVEGTPRRSRGMPGGGCDPHGEPTLEQAPARTRGERSPGRSSLFWGAAPRGRDPRWSSG